MGSSHTVSGLRQSVLLSPGFALWLSSSFLKANDQQALCFTNSSSIWGCLENTGSWWSPGVLRRQRHTVHQGETSPPPNRAHRIGKATAQEKKASAQQTMNNWSWWQRPTDVTSPLGTLRCWAPLGGCSEMHYLGNSKMLIHNLLYEGNKKLENSIQFSLVSPRRPFKWSWVLT